MGKRVERASGMARSIAFEKKGTEETQGTKGWCGFQGLGKNSVRNCGIWTGL